MSSSSSYDQKQMFSIFHRDLKAMRAGLAEVGGATKSLIWFMSFWQENLLLQQISEKISWKSVIAANPANKTFSNLFHSMTKHLKNRSDDVDRDGAFPFIIKSIEGVF